MVFGQMPDVDAAERAESARQDREEMYGFVREPQEMVRAGT